MFSARTEAPSPEITGPESRETAMSPTGGKRLCVVSGGGGVCVERLGRVGHGCWSEEATKL